MMYGQLELKKPRILVVIERPHRRGILGLYERETLPLKVEVEREHSVPVGHLERCCEALERLALTRRP